VVPPPEVLQRAAARLRAEAALVATAEAGPARAFAASGWRGPAAHRFEAALRDQRRSVDHACRLLQALAAQLDLDALTVRPVPGVTAASAPGARA
jgi:uncharacterized protein YukE